MKGEIVFLVFGGILILVLGGALLFLIKSPSITGDVINSGDIVYVQEIPINFSVTDQRIIGINIDTDYLGMATIMRGNEARREVTIVNPFNIPVDVELSFSEDIADLVSAEIDNFRLNANNDSLKITVSVSPNEETPLGNYNGVMTAVMKRV